MNYTIEEYRREIMKILDNFYQKLKSCNKHWIQIISTSDECDKYIPKEMLTGEIDVESNGIILRTWKYIPSDISEKEIAELEDTIGTKLPLPLKAYYTSYFHLFDFEINFSGNSPVQRMTGIYNAYNKFMIKHGYIPFTWDKQYGCLFCMKVDQNNNDCGIFLIDHEDMFNFEEDAKQEEINSAMRFAADNFLDYLNKMAEFVR